MGRERLDCQGRIDAIEQEAASIDGSDFGDWPQADRFVCDLDDGKAGRRAGDRLESAGLHLNDLHQRKRHEPASHKCA
jgi:hypothetical protein